MGLAKARRRSGLLDRCAGSVHRSLGGIGSTCCSRSGTSSSRSSARSRISGRSGGRSGGWSRSRGRGRSGCWCFFFLATCNQSSGSNNSCQNERLVHFENYLMSLEGKLCQMPALQKRQPRKKRTRFPCLAPDYTKKLRLIRENPRNAPKRSVVQALQQGFKSGKQLFVSKFVCGSAKGF